MTVEQRIQSLSTNDRVLIANGIKNNFPNINNGDGTVIQDSNREFELYRELLSLIKDPLPLFFEKHNIPITIIDSLGHEHPSNVSDALLYLLNT